MQIELFLLVLSTLFFASILAGKAGSRFGVPALLLFLAVGMLFGSDGLGIHFDNIKVAQMVGTVALSAILFSGGLDTKVSDIKPVLGPGVMLATVGYFVPTGRTMLHPGDRLMLLSDNQQGLDDTLQRLGIGPDATPDATPKRKWYTVFFDDID